MSGPPVVERKPMVFDPKQARSRGREVLKLEAEALSHAHGNLGATFEDACEMILECPGRVVVTGMGKAGLIGGKISATFASTGTSSLFLHPGEALHGDLGRVRQEDIVLALSKSGATPEVVRLVPAARSIGASVLAICSTSQTPLGEEADIVLELGEAPEACPLGLAPTVSTTLMLAIGDALAMAVLEGRNFTREEFAAFHPAGSLGKSLMRVGEIMRKGEELPLLSPESTLADTLTVMTETPGRPGAAVVTNPDGTLAGVFTDGDLRRLAQAGSIPVESLVREHMATEPEVIFDEQLVGEVLGLFRETHVDQIPVVDAEGRVVGLVDVQDLLEVRL